MAVVAQRRRRHQASRIHRIERHVAADGRIHRGAQLRLVIDSRQAHPAGEVDQRLLLRKLVGQAAFTITIVVLFNLLVPVGWTVGLLRIEDVAIGCGVSLVVGVLFWPRGVSTVVGEDLADAFRRGAEYLTQSVEWALSELMVPPSAAAQAASAAVRLDDAIRGLFTEQGSKRLRKEDLWTLVNAASRLRLTAYTLSGLRTPAPIEEGDFGGACLPLAGSGEYAGAPACTTLRTATAGLAGFYDAIADEVGHRSAGPARTSAAAGHGGPGAAPP